MYLPRSTQRNILKGMLDPEIDRAMNFKLRDIRSKDPVDYNDSDIDLIEDVRKELQDFANANCDGKNLGVEIVWAPQIQT